MKRTRISGRRGATRCASSRPLICGMTTSESMRSIVPLCRSQMRSASDRKLTPERFEGEGLLDERHRRVHHAVAEDGILRVSRHEENPHFGAEGRHTLRELAPADLRHDDVGEHEVDRSLVPLTDEKRFRSEAYARALRG